MIYFDNAATTLQKPPCVFDAVVAAMKGMGNPARGTHGTALGAARTVYEARCRIAALFGAPDAQHVVFTANATEALNIAICGAIEPNANIISTDLEHNSVLRPLFRLSKAGASISFVRAKKDGTLRYDDFEQFIFPETKAIVCTHASNLTGNVLDLTRIGKIAHKHGLLFIVDASQTAGVLPIDMQKMGIDILCFTGHKSLMGPQGTGGLCLGKHVSVRPLKVGGTGVKSFSKTQPEELPTRLEAGTLNGHGIAGLSAAVRFITDTGLATIHAHETMLMRRFYEGVRQMPDITVYGDFSAETRAAIVALNLRDYDSGAVADELAQQYGIATRSGAHCAPRMHAALGTEQQGAVRFSFSYFNTTQEVDRALVALKEISL